MSQEKEIVRQTYEAKNGKTYCFKKKHLGARFRFPGNSKAYTTVNCITDAGAMERLIKSNDKKLEIVSVKSSSEGTGGKTAPKKPKSKVQTSGDNPSVDTVNN